MNTSHTHMLSAEQLEAYLENKLSPEEMTRVQHLLDDSELSREALEGYAAVPGAFADVEEIRKAIAKKSGMTVNWGIISLGVVAIAAISLLLTIFYPEDKAPVAERTDATVDYTVSIPVPENTLSPAEDHFVNPEANVMQITIPTNEIATGDTTYEMNYPEKIIAPIPVDDKKQLIIDSVPVVPKKVEKTYNAQVGFIVDLKVTEYDKYYATPIEVKELPLTGVPAQYEDDHGMTRDYEEEETVKLVPADQFLREGLIAFRDARYGKCISKMEVLLEHNPDDINALFYTAVSYVKLEMYSKAIPLLDKIILAENNVFDEEAEWYKALALEGNGDSGTSQSLFRKIADEGGFYSKQAANKLK